MTVNSVCSSTGAAAPAAPAAPPTAPPGAAAGAATIVTPNFALKASISSARSNTDMCPIASRISSLLKLVCVAIAVSPTRLRSSARGALSPERLEGTHHRLQQSLHRADDPRQRGLERPAQLGQELGPRRQRSEPLHLLRRHRLAVHEADLDRRLVVLPHEIGQHLARGYGVRPPEHQGGRAPEMAPKPGPRPALHPPPPQGVLHNPVVHPRLRQPPPQGRDPGHVE